MHLHKFYIVGEYSPTISYCPEIRLEKHGLTEKDISDPQSLSFAVSKCEALRRRVRKFYLENQSTARVPDLKDDKKKQRINIAEWVAKIDEGAFSDLKEYVENWGYTSTEPADHDGVAEALRYFNSMDRNILCALGVAIVEGQFPGSDYYAAELNSTVANANEAAERSKLPIRFYEREENPLDGLDFTS